MPPWPCACRSWHHRHPGRKSDLQARTTRAVSARAKTCSSRDSCVQSRLSHSASIGSAGHARRPQNGVQKHVAAGFKMLRPGVFDFVVADAVFAGYEDHRGRRDPGQVHSIGPRTADHRHGAHAHRTRATVDIVDELAIKGLRREINHGFEYHVDAGVILDTLAELAKRGI